MHYKDESEAHVGDMVKGSCHSKAGEVSGVMLSISPGSDTCNCIVGIGRAVSLGLVSAPAIEAEGGRQPCGYGVVFEEYVLSECKSLEKIG